VRSAWTVNVLLLEPLLPPPPPQADNMSKVEAISNARPIMTIRCLPFIYIFMVRVGAHGPILGPPVAAVQPWRV
jgi:hypothetical protein